MPAETISLSPFNLVLQNNNLLRNPHIIPQPLPLSLASELRQSHRIERGKEKVDNEQTRCHLICCCPHLHLVYLLFNTTYLRSLVHYPVRVYTRSIVMLTFHTIIILFVSSPSSLAQMRKVLFPSKTNIKIHIVLY